MGNIYITGHRNPDIDSLCSAMAYATLKNKIDPENTYIPVRCGHLSDNTKTIFESLGIEAPTFMPDVLPKVRNVMMSSKTRIDASAKLSDMADSYTASNPPVIPVYDGDDFYGLLSVDDITFWLMNEISTNGSITEYPLIRDIMKEQEEPLLANDLIEDGLASLNMSKKRGLAVFDDGKYVGYVSRRCFLNVPKYDVILVDHNEPRQSIRGIEKATIREIVDHHRIDSVRTEMPIFIDAEPVGSTCTIVHQLFLRNGLMPDKETAKLLLTGIISDTLILRSPTTTPIDVRTANTLSIICGVELESYGLSMFSKVASLKNSDPEKSIGADFKTYEKNNVKVGIGQCEVTTLSDLYDYSDKYLDALESFKTKNGLSWAVLMITDIIKEHSVLLSTDYKYAADLQYEHLSRGIFDMPGVMSRKKQLLPEVLSVLD